MSSPVRRGQMIAPFGVGSLFVLKGAVSVVSAGLDHWFPSDLPGNTTLDLSEFKVSEWRLEQHLGVNHFMLPPDFRKNTSSIKIPNCYMTIPVLRFPCWHVCPRCHLLMRLSLDRRAGRNCPDCEEQGFKFRLRQVRFVAMCDRGHLQDFPWREWVHRDAQPTCNRKIYLRASASSALASQVVLCDCGQRRTLEGIMSVSADRTSTRITDTLRSDRNPFPCQGLSPWLGQDCVENCDRPLIGSLRNASNLHFPRVKRAIYVPRTDGHLASIFQIFERPMVASALSMARQFGQNDPEALVKVLRTHCPLDVQNIASGDLRAALGVIINQASAPVPTQDELETETQLRSTEYRAFLTERDEETLSTRRPSINEYESWLGEVLTSITLVQRLRETRVFVGFSRRFPQPIGANPVGFRLRRSNPEPEAFWLPAYVVYGEGIFLEFNDSALATWEAQSAVQSRVSRLNNYLLASCQRRNLPARQVSPRYVAVHTFSHLLMNRLTFECGYSSASLCERLYFSEGNDKMTGLLIYTAAGDSEGTLGGLVRMGKPGSLERIIQRALEAASWCSADPVCMELGRESGQGPDSCNLAACHSCALVPETACEEFNRLLDRGTVIGDIIDREIGFFSRILTKFE